MRNGVQQKRDDSVDDFGKCRNQHGDSIQKSLRQACNQLKRRVQNHGQTVHQIFVHIGGEIGRCAGLAAKRFAVTDLLKVVQPAGNALVAVAVEGVEVDAGTTVHAGVNLGAGQDRVAVGVHDTGSSCGVGVDK